MRVLHQNTQHAMGSLWEICSPPDIVRVPVGVDNDLLRADGNGTTLTGSQVMFSQIDSVGVAPV